MKPGDVVELKQNARSISTLAPTAAQRGWPDGILEFETITLGALVAETNRTPGARIMLADAALADVTLSGPLQRAR